MATYPDGPEKTFARAIRDLGDLGARYAVIGGIAFGIRVAPRTTTDIDFAVATETEAEGDALIFGLQRRGYVIRRLKRKR